MSLGDRFGDAGLLRIGPRGNERRFARASLKILAMLPTSTTTLSTDRIGR